MALEARHRQPQLQEPRRLPRVQVAAGLRHCLAQVVPLVLDAKAFVADFFYGASFEADWDTDPALEYGAGAAFVDREVKGALEALFGHGRGQAAVVLVEELAKLLEGADNRTGKWGAADLEVLAMVVDVEAVIHANKDRSEFVVSTLTHPRHGLQLKLRLLFNAYVQAQIDWIGNVHANTRQAGVLLPLRKFPSFVDASYAAINTAGIASTVRCRFERSGNFDRSLTGTGGFHAVPPPAGSIVPTFEFAESVWVGNAAGSGPAFYMLFGNSFTTSGSDREWHATLVYVTKRPYENR